MKNGRFYDKRKSSSRCKPPCTRPQMVNECNLTTSLKEMKKNNCSSIEFSRCNQLSSL